MSAKLRVDELRAELAKRGLSTTGTKPSLARRLESAMQQENAVPDGDGGGRGRKRGREGNSDEEEYREMSVKQLREEAKRRGVSVAGTKKELIERLSGEESNSAPADDDPPEEDEEKEDYREMSVKQLREEAKRRGVSVAGSKKELIERLSGEYINAYPANDAPVEEEGEKEEYRDMSLKQLREEAKRRGVSVSGSKKELIERLLGEGINSSPATDPPVEEGKMEEEEEEKIVTATKKGAGVLDQHIPDHVKSHYHVLQLDGDVYEAMLNQTNIGNNNNKFYVIQLLESDGGGNFMVYNRWGRVGVKGQNKLSGPYTCLDTAVQEFENKFYDKTKNLWSERKEFQCFPRCYAWLEMDYGQEESLTGNKEKMSSALTVQPRETRLEPRIAKFISLICNVSMMKQQMMEIGYNANKLPLGKLSRSTILKGYDVLKRISDVIGTSNRSKLEQLSGEFYTVIPHDFGFKKMREFVIDTREKLKRKLEMVEALGEIELATKLLGDEQGSEEDPLYSCYNRLHCELTPVDLNSEESAMIATYVLNTHAKTHSQYSVDIVQIFRASKEGEAERFRKFSGTHNRMLLWHGSRLTNWTGILSQGLRIAPPEAPATGYMFGKGVYFADMFSKSANYCYASRQAPSGVLLLCEVALGDMEELFNAKYDADQLPEGKLSTKGVGKTTPNLAYSRKTEDGVIVPLGKQEEQQKLQGSLLYNEYIVYNVDQIRMRYVVQVNFQYN